MSRLGDDELSPEQIAVLKDRMDRPDPLKFLADLAKVFADPERAEKAIKRFETEKAAADRAKASLVEARAKHDEYIATSTAELDRSRASFRKLEISLAEREGRLHAAEARLRERDETEARRSGRLEVFPGGLSRERDLAPDAPDPHFGGNAA
jgi:septal ring factor EnvC (AmiA/AmiB activator)